MRYIGRIITSNKIDDVSEFIEVTQGTSTIKDNETKIPTLIIGYKNAVKICGKVKITDKRIGKNLYWTFSKRERRSDYISDLGAFYEEVSRFAMSCCKYEYLDPSTWSKEAKSSFVEIMGNKHKKVMYITDSMYYIYYPRDGKTYGISRAVLIYLGKPDGYFEEWAAKSGSVTVIKDDDADWLKIAKQKFVVPLLYYLKTF